MSESVGTAPEAPGPAARDAGGPPPGAGPSRGRAWLASRRRELRFLALFVVICAVAGAVCAVIWKLTAPVPTITVSNDGSAAVSNQALSEFFGADADFMIIGMFGGVALGTLAWHWFKGWGWPVAMVAIVGSALAALITWRLGTLLGPHDFAGRLAGAPGQRSPLTSPCVRPRPGCCGHSVQPFRCCSTARWVATRRRTSTRRPITTRTPLVPGRPPARSLPPASPAADIA